MGEFYYTTKYPSRGVIKVPKSEAARFGDGAISYRCHGDPSFGRYVGRTDVFEDLTSAERRVEQKLRRKLQLALKQLEKARAEASAPIKVIVADVAARRVT